MVQQNQHTYTISRLFQVWAQFQIIIDRFLLYPHIKNSPRARRSFVQMTRLARRRAHHWGRWSRRSSAQAPMRTPPRRVVHPLPNLVFLQLYLFKDHKNHLFKVSQCLRVCSLYYDLIISRILFKCLRGEICNIEISFSFKFWICG